MFCHDDRIIIARIESTLARMDQVLAYILRTQEKIMATQADLAKQIDTLTAQVVKIGGESGKTLKMVTDLQSQIANLGNVDPALQASVDALAVQIKTVDDMVPDAPTP